MKRKRIVRERLTEPRERRRERLAIVFTPDDFAWARNKLDERKLAKRVWRDNRRRRRLLQLADDTFIEMMRGLGSSSPHRRHRSAIKLANHCAANSGEGLK